MYVPTINTNESNGSCVPNDRNAIEFIKFASNAATLEMRSTVIDNVAQITVHNKSPHPFPFQSDGRISIYLKFENNWFGWICN